MQSQDKKTRIGLNGTALALIAAFGPGLVFAPNAQAQAPATTPKASTAAATVDAEDDAEEIVVTGTAVRGIKAVGSETVTLNREAIEATGMNNVRDVLGTLTQFQNNVAGGASETLNTSGGPTTGVQTVITSPTVGGNQNAINGINLRGLGNGATLVLVNGFRQGSSGGESTVDINAIPVSALQRIDVIADGVSAVYGSDAVAGVVNFVLRQDYKGIEGGARYSWQRGSETEGASITAGTGWDFLGGGNVLVTFDYDHRGALLQSSTPYLLADKSSLGGQNAFGRRAAAAAGQTPPSLSPYIVFNTAGTPTATLTAPYCGGTGNTVTGANASPLFLDVAQCSSGRALSYFAVAPVTGTAVPTTAQVQAAGQPVFIDNANYTDVLGERFQRSLTMTGSQRINDIFNLRSQATYSNRETISRGGLVSLNTTVNPGSPYYIAGLGTTPTNTPASYNVVTPLGVRINRTFGNTLNTATSLDVKLPAEWAAEANVTYNYTRDLTGNFSQYRSKSDGFVIAGAGAAQADLVRQEANAGRFNYYANTNVFTEDSPLTIPAKIKSRNIYTAFRLKFDGPLFSLPGGQVKAAFGAEHSKEMADRDGYAWGTTGAFPNIVAAPTGMNINDLEQEVDSYFAEVNVPIISEMNKFPLFESLTFSAAVRTDEYSQFGKTTNPRYSLAWEPIKDLTLRGSYNTAFRSPGLQNGASNVLDANLTIDIPGQRLVNSTTAPSPYAGLGTPVSILGYFGRRDYLDPETSDNKQLGFDYAPSWFDGFRVSATWYSIDYKNRIDSPNVPIFLSSNAIAEGYSAQNIIELKQNQTLAGQQRCDANRNLANLDPALVAYVAPQLLQNIVFGAQNWPTAVCTAPLLIDGRVSNLARQVQEGYDVNVSYRTDTPIGQINGSVSLTKVTKVEASAANGGVQLPNVIDVVGGVLGTQGRANVGWSNAGFTATLAANYTGSYSNNRKSLLQGVVMPTYEIGSNITYDLNLGYRFGEGTGPLEGLRTSLSVQNLLDNDPPWVFTGDSVYDSTYANPFGRIFTLRLTKEF